MACRGRLKKRSNPVRGLIVVCAALVLSACATMTEGIRARGKVAGFLVDTRVDAEITRYYVEQYSEGRRSVPSWDAWLDSIHRQLATRVPTRAELDAWSKHYSADLATIVLARQLSAQPDQHGLRRAHKDELAMVREAAREGKLASMRIASEPLFVFVPGWLYRSDPTSGADLAAQRTILARHGGRVHFADIAENDSVERNAARLAALLHQLAEREHNLVLVSASKGGAEVALALSQIGDAPQAQRIRAWINIGGLLRGTALADLALSWPACWFVRLAVLPDGDFNGLRSLARARSIERMQMLRWPSNVIVVDYLALPLSGQVSPRARAGYALLRGHGPNDGLTYVLDALAPDGVALLDFGVDHYFGQSDIDIKTLALARAVLRSSSRTTPVTRHTR